MQTRTENPSEPRPECGHATNALLVVGERSLLRGLFLDRRAFLHSYDPAADADGAVLQAILGAALPVCAGINLEYYFSRVDNTVFGAGTKIPHNVVGLHGVCDGSMGDLRVGLPVQMVELHEPTRLLVVVLAPRQRVAEVLGRLPDIERLVTNRWVRLATVEQGRTWTWRDGGFVAGPADAQPLLSVARSEDWYRGRVGDLAPAWVGPS